MNTTTTSDNGRFSREILAGYDPEKMQGATILLVGAGALAQSLLPNLVLPGIGEIRLCDFDFFEPHNRGRSIYFPTDDEASTLGLMKAKVVAHKVRTQMLAENPIMHYALVPIQQLGFGAFTGVDVVVSAVDNPRARAYLSDVCRYLGITLIEGGFDGPAIAMSCFPGVSAEAATDEPCYRCSNPHLAGTFSCQRYAAEAAKKGIIAAIQPASATLGGMMAEAAIQAVHGETPTGFKRTTLNVRTGDHRQYRLTRALKCPGIHARLADEPIQLQLGAGDPLSALIAAVQSHLGAGAEIDLGEPLIVEAYCMSCGDVVTVESPEWAYDMRPRCRAKPCGGAWVSKGRPVEGHTPLKPIRLDARTDQRILDLTCAKAGFTSMNLVHAFQPTTGEGAVLRMSGGLADLFDEV
ncbi:hypothetical protein DSM112329_00188 [Paraconexibacter sp. AEG42_29]|uniref:THIF-type NAD/FAD binding fold domain-containing protein n=1 Tax=Paraconexibacter sp. AEG42_29 TaxID=2997339 RepID=A0AAU7ANZ9_9ACTN